MFHTITGNASHFNVKNASHGFGVWTLRQYLGRQELVLCASTEQNTLKYEL
jgi:hypothetical protein